MNGNGRKPSSKQSNNERPWWHSGSHCLAALLWVFTLSVTWYGLLGGSKVAWSVALFSLVLAVLQSSMASAKGKRQ